MCSIDLSSKRQQMEEVNQMNVTTRLVSRQAWRIGLGLLAYLAVSLPVFGAEVNLPVAKNLSSHGVTQAELNGLDAVMLQAIQQGKIRGCSYLVAHKEKSSIERRTERSQRANRFFWHRSLNPLPHPC